MNTHDKRIFTRLEQSQQDKYLKEVLKNSPDAQDKFDEVEVAHEPIKLLLKRSGRKAVVAAPAPPDTGTDQ